MGVRTSCATHLRNFWMLETRADRFGSGISTPSTVLIKMDESNTATGKRAHACRINVANKNKRF